MQLSQHFTLEELIFSQTASRLGIDNTPSASVVGNLTVLASTLEGIRTLVGKPVKVSSGYRCPALNKATGGALKSAHLEGLAADINVEGYSPKQLATLIRDSGIAFDQLILEFDSWVHVGLSRNEMKKETLTIRKGTGYMKGIV